MDITICVGTTCHLMGAPALIDCITAVQGIQKGKITMEYATCFSVCQGKMTPPVVMINGEYYDNMEPVALKKLILAKIEAGE